MSELLSREGFGYILRKQLGGLMRQAVMTAPGKIELRDVEVPVPRAGQVQIRVQRIGVCGSDIHVFHGKHPFVTYPLIQGH